jgi:hypothetical protein
MSMEGDLASVGVADLLQMLQLGGKSGALVLSRSLEEVVLWTDRGLLVSVYALRGEGLSLAWTLYLEGLLSAERLHASRAEGSAEERWMERLGSERLAPQQRAQSLLLKHTSRLLVEVAGWSTGHFAFAEKGPSVRPPAVLEPPLQPASFWLEVLRRRDEIGSIAAECRKRLVVFEAEDGPRGEAPISLRARRLLEMIRPHAGIDGIFEAFHQARYEALEAARELLGSGRLVPRSGEEAVRLERTFWNLVPEEADAEAQFLMEEPIEEEVEFLMAEEEPVGAFPHSAAPAPTSAGARETGRDFKRFPSPAPAGEGPGVRASGAASSRKPMHTGAVGQGAEAERADRSDPALQRRLRELTEGLDEVIPELPRGELWKRRLIFAAVALGLLLVAALLVGASLGLVRPESP